MASNLIGRKNGGTMELEYLKTGTDTVEKSANFDIVDDDGIAAVLMDTTSGNLTSLLPTLADSLGRELIFCKSGVNNYIIDGNGSTINGSSTFTITSNTSALRVKAFPSEWRIV